MPIIRNTMIALMTKGKPTLFGFLNTSGKNIKLNTPRIIAPFATKAILADIPAKLINIFDAMMDCFIILNMKV